MTVNRVKQTAPLGKTVVINASGQGKVSDLETSLGGIRTKAKRAIGRTQVSASCEFIGDLGNADVGGEVLARTEFVGDDAPER